MRRLVCNIKRILSSKGGILKKTRLFINGKKQIVLLFDYSNNFSNIYTQKIEFLRELQL